MPKLKAFADDKLNFTSNVKFFSNIVRKKCWLSAFSPFPAAFSKGYFRMMSSLCGKLLCYKVMNIRSLAFDMDCQKSKEPRSHNRL